MRLRSVFNRHSVLGTTTLIVFLVCSPIHAQIVGGRTVTHATFKVGGSVASAGDVNKDGYPDLIIGDTAASPGGRTRAGSVYVYSGKDNKLLMQFDGKAPYRYLGWSVAGAGDVNKDGYSDLIIGATGASPGNTANAGSAYVFSGKDKKLLMQFDGTETLQRLGNSVAGAGDVNQDGYADVIVGMDLPV